MPYNLVDLEVSGLNLAPTVIYEGVRYLTWRTSNDHMFGRCNLDGSGFNYYKLTEEALTFFPTVDVNEGIIAAMNYGPSGWSGRIHAVTMLANETGKIESTIDSGSNAHPYCRIYSGKIYAVWVRTWPDRGIIVSRMNFDLTGYESVFVTTDPGYFYDRIFLHVDDSGIHFVVSAENSDGGYYNVYTGQLDHNLTNFTYQQRTTNDMPEHENSWPMGIARLGTRIYYVWNKNFDSNLYLASCGLDGGDYHEVSVDLGEGSQPTMQHLVALGNRIHCCTVHDSKWKVLDWSANLDDVNIRTIIDGNGWNGSLAVNWQDVNDTNLYGAKRYGNIHVSIIPANIDAPTVLPWPAYVNPAVVIQPTVARSAHPRIVVQTEPPTGDFSDNLHYKILVYSDQEMTNLIHEVDTLANPEKFQYSTNKGNTWTDFPSNGLGPSNYGALLRVNINTGPLMKVWVKAYVGYV